MGYYSAIKRKYWYLLQHGWMNLECILLNQRHKRVIGNIRIGKSIERESRLMVARQLTGARKLLAGIVSFGDNENIPKFILVIVTPFCEYTENH